MITLEVKGMSCNHCVASVTEALSKVPGVTKVDVDLLAAKATIVGEFDVQAAKDAVAKIGFEPGEAQ